MRESMENNNFTDFEKSFWQLSRQMEYLWRRIYADTFPGSQSYIMFILQQKGPQKMSELAQSLHLTAGAITTASDHLLELDYIARVRATNDRRIVRLELTDKGQEALTELQHKGNKIMKQVFEGVSDNDLNRMTAIFQQGIINITDVENRSSR